MSRGGRASGRRGRVGPPAGVLLLALAGGAWAQPVGAADPAPSRLVHLDGRPMVLDAPPGLRAGQPLYVLDPLESAPVADRLPVAVVAAAASDGPGRWAVVALCMADGAGGARGTARAESTGRAASSAHRVAPPPAVSAPPRAPATGLPASAPVAVVPPTGAARLGRCAARARAMPADEWRPYRRHATLTLDVGAADRARLGDAYAVFGAALADRRTGRVAGFALRAVCRIVAVGDLTAECAVDRGAWPEYGLPDWQQGGPAYPVDAPAVGDLAALGRR